MRSRLPPSSVALAAFGITLVVAACSSSEDAPTYRSRDALLDPATCGSCHTDHYREWSGSMHAYASDDPVFVAMNRRGQRETNGALGSFCVKCHAPMAVREGATVDGLNLAELPSKLKGVTCFFCHTVESVEGSHDAALTLSQDPVMHGELADAIPNTAHRTAYSPLHDRDRIESASLCGTCHDVVSPPGAAIERTFGEWQSSVYAHAPGGATCGQCHMAQSTDLRPIAQYAGAPPRRTHAHTFPGVDIAVTPFPEADAQKQAVQVFLDTTLQSAVCVKQVGEAANIRVILDNVAAGHGWPSGAAQDRRVWVEVVAYSGANVLYRSGAVADGTSPTSGADPDSWLLHDCMFDGAGAQTHMFWQAASYESNTLPGQKTFDPTDPRYYQTHVEQHFPRGEEVINGVPDRITMRVRLQPIGLDVLDDLVTSGDLDPAVRAATRTFTVGGEAPLEWTPDAATDYYLEDHVQVRCVTKTNLNVQADKVPATNHVRCAP